MAVTADRVWAEDVLRLYATSLYPAALRQISALTGMPLGSVKSCLHRARCRLPAELGAYASRYYAGVLACT